MAIRDRLCSKNATNTAPRLQHFACRGSATSTYTADTFHSELYEDHVKIVILDKLRSCCQNPMATQSFDKFEYRLCNGSFGGAITRKSYLKGLPKSFSYSNGLSLPKHNSATRSRARKLSGSLPISIFRKASNTSEAHQPLERILANNSNTSIYPGPRRTTVGSSSHDPPLVPNIQPHHKYQSVTSSTEIHTSRFDRAKELSKSDQRRTRRASAASASCFANDAVQTSCPANSATRNKRRDIPGSNSNMLLTLPHRSKSSYPALSIKDDGELTYGSTEYLDAREVKLFHETDTKLQDRSSIPVSRGFPKSESMKKLMDAGIKEIMRIGQRVSHTGSDDAQEDK